MPTEPEICYFDGDCGEGRFCEYFPDCVGGPTGLIACAGTCQDIERPTEYCLSDDDCGAGSRCPTEQDVCLTNPDSNLDVCYWACEPLPPPPPPEPNICLSDNDCASTDRCATELDVCICRDPACDVCYSQCVPREPICADVISYAMNPDTGACEEFPNSCTPDGWELCDPNSTTDVDAGPAPDGSGGDAGPNGP